MLFLLHSTGNFQSFLKIGIFKRKGTDLDTFKELGRYTSGIMLIELGKDIVKHLIIPFFNCIFGFSKSLYPS